MKLRTVASLAAAFLVAAEVFAGDPPVPPAPLSPPGPSADARTLYMKHCSECHHPDRYGLVGPPLLPEYFGRKKAEQIGRIIRDGLPATNMPPFGGKLTENEIGRIVDYIRTPVEKPRWGMEEMRSTWEMAYFGEENNKPRYDMTNFFMIVEGGTGSVHFMDGDSFRLLGKVKVGAIHGGPKFGRKLRYAFAVSRGGWVIKYDLVDLREVGRIRGGISTRNIAVSSNGRYLAQANLLPRNLVIIDTFTMKPRRIIEPGGIVGAVYDLRTRGEFVVSLRDRAEVLVIDDDTLDVSKIRIDQPFTDFFIDPQERYLVGTSRGSSHFSVVDMDGGAVVATVDTEGGMPHLASAAIWHDDSGTYAAFPHIGRPLITVIEMYRWKVKGKVKTKGAGFFARTHDNIPHIWVDTGTDAVQLVDKTTLEIVGEVVPRKGRRAMHIEFTKDGAYALVSVWESDGEVVIYDTKNLEVVKRLPFKKPVGKYNATNKRF